MGTQQIWGPLPPTPREGQNLKTFFIYFIHIYSKATENLSSVNRHTASGHFNFIQNLLSFIIIVQVKMLCARHKPRIKGWVQNSNGNTSNASNHFSSLFPLPKKCSKHTTFHNEAIYIWMPWTGQCIPVTEHTRLFAEGAPLSSLNMRVAHV